jgi:hypothetical protein
LLGDEPNETVKRNTARFPEDFAFRLDADEARSLISKVAISRTGPGGRRTAPLAFTEHGALMAATILNSPGVIQMSVHLVRAFIQFRAALGAHPLLAA